MLFLGVDAGGTKTDALLATEASAVLSVGQSGPGNWEGVGLDGVHRALQEATGQALAEAGTAPTDVAAATYGLAGLDWPSDEERLRPVIERLGVSGPQVLVNDSFVALRASAPWGVVIIAGTGTTCAGRNREGETARTLGLGWAFDDWGSAPDVAEACVRAIARAYTGRGPATTLTHCLVHLFGAPDDAGLLEGLSRGRYDLQAAVTQVIQALAEEASYGDGAAIEISRHGGCELGGRATTVIRRLGMEKDAPHVVLAGGLFRTHNPVLREALEKTVRAVAPEACLVPLAIPPVVGSVLLAMEAARVRVTAEARRRLGEETRRALSMNTPQQRERRELYPRSGEPQP